MKKRSPVYNFHAPLLLLLGVVCMLLFGNVQTASGYAAQGMPATVESLYEAPSPNITEKAGTTTFTPRVKFYKKRYFLGGRAYDRFFIKDAAPYTPNDNKHTGIDVHSPVHGLQTFFFLVRPSYYIFLYLYTLF